MSIADPLHDLLGRLGLPGTLPGDPMPLLKSWLDEEIAARKVPNPNAMVLASATPGGDPSCRVVLCKALEPDAGALVFFTNYDSRKGGELDANPRCSAVFHWDHAARQARVGGAAARVSAEESDEYFRSRPLLSRLGAWASDQSRPLAARTELLTRTREVMRRFGVTPLHLVSPAGAPEIPRPPHWGGYRILLDSVELWLGGSGRLHDRARWTRTLAGSPSPWAATRLQP